MGSATHPAKTAPPLAPFAFDWVGGDIHGLQALAGRLYGYVPAISDVITALDRRAGQLTGDGPGGWQGSAASAFTTSWGRDALAGGALAAVIGEVGQITGALAVALSQIENALEAEADAAAQHGVQIMPGGQPGPEPDGPPADAAEAAQQQWAVAYQQVWQQAQAEANQARQNAATQLAAVYQQIAPPGQEPAGATASDNITVGSLLADLWAVPTANRREVSELIEKLDGRQALLEREIAAARSVGKPVPTQVRDELPTVEAKLDRAASDLAGQDMHSYGAVEGVLYGIGHSEFATVDDTRGFAISAGHEAEHLWDSVF